MTILNYHKNRNPVNNYLSTLCKFKLFNYNGVLYFFDKEIGN